MAVLIVGATGYLGQALGRALVERGSEVRGLARPGAEHRLPSGVRPVTGEALDASTWRDAAAGAGTLVHLVGTPRPNPTKTRQFQEVDLASIRVAAAVARDAGVRHLVYVSVAHPAPVMRAYIAARQAGERLVREAGVPATILRPWYVLGPGHWWPYALVPAYALLRAWPPTRAGAMRLGLVTRRQMVTALVYAVEHPAPDVRVMDVPAIRRGGV